MYQQVKCDKTQPERKRGRPSGKNRVPLSKEERRARNAQYERERRIETADAMLLLADTLGCSSNESNEQILKMAVDVIAKNTRLEKTNNYKLEDMRRINEGLSKQILKLQKDLSAKQGIHQEHSLGTAQKRKIKEEPVLLISDQIQKRHQHKKMKRDAEASTSYYIQPEEHCQPTGYGQQASNTIREPQLTSYGQQTLNIQTELQPNSFCQPTRYGQPTSYSLPADSLDFASESEWQPSVPSSPEDAMVFKSEFNWTLSDHIVEASLPMERQTSSESEVECSSPSDLDHLLGSLSDEEKTLLWGVVQQIEE